ncbi:MAG: hypothetical protein U9R50_00820 [Campylobacterota bacterium]|nr:hypothetical protein [Campylobacterota bacterium]
MLKYFLLLFSSLTFLWATNPLPYAQLGDDIYNSLDEYKKLATNINQEKSSIESYIKKVQKTKKLGYEAEISPKLSKNYLTQLRECDKERQIILTQLNALLYRSMDNKDTKTFKKLIDSNLIKLNKVQDDLMPFYKNNFKSGSIKKLDTVLASEKRYKRDKKVANKEYRNYVEEKRIQRMRDASEKADTSREAELDQEIAKQRQEINIMMENELIR